MLVVLCFLGFGVGGQSYSKFLASTVITKPKLLESAPGFGYVDFSGICPQWSQVRSVGSEREGDPSELGRK